MAEVIKTYEAALDWLFYELPNQSGKALKDQASLDQSRRLIELLGNPQDKVPTIHLAATSGKGSTAWMATQMMLKSGFHVGTLMSPHVYDFRERFLVNGKFVSREETLQAIRMLKKKLDEYWQQGSYPTFYQAVVALGYIVFANHDLDYLVIETGVGGTYDTTNVITNCDKIAVLGNIGLDHTNILGGTIAEIAKQKAGIITGCSQVVALRQSAEINDIFRAAAENKGVNIVFVEPATDYQQSNYALAVKACETVAQRDGWNLVDEVARQVLGEFNLPGRFESRKVGSKTVMLDGAHNEQKMLALVERLKDIKFVVVLSVGSRKDALRLVEISSPIAKRFIFTRYKTLSEHESKASQDISKLDIDGIEHEVIEDIDSVVRQIRDSNEDYLVTGSFYLVSEIGSLLP